MGGARRAPFRKGVPDEASEWPAGSVSMRRPAIKIASESSLPDAVVSSFSSAIDLP